MANNNYEKQVEKEEMKIKEDTYHLARNAIQKTINYSKL